MKINNIGIYQFNRSNPDTYIKCQSAPKPRHHKVKIFGNSNLQDCFLDKLHKVNASSNKVVHYPVGKKDHYYFQAFPNDNIVIAIKIEDSSSNIMTKNECKNLIKNIKAIYDNRVNDVLENVLKHGSDYITDSDHEENEETFTNDAERLHHIDNTVHATRRFS